MDNIVGLFTNMDGRLGRQQWWIGVVIMIVVYIVLGWVLGAIFGASMFAAFNSGSIADASQIMATMQKAAWVGLVLSIILAYPYIAIGVKRRHDRDNNGMDVIIFIVLGIVINILGGMGWTANILGSILGIVMLVYAIYMLVVLGFLRGTAGPNQYGADPLGGAA